MGFLPQSASSLCILLLQTEGPTFGVVKKYLHVGAMLLVFLSSTRTNFLKLPHVHGGKSAQLFRILHLHGSLNSSQVLLCFLLSSSSIKLVTRLRHLAEGAGLGDGAGPGVGDGPGDGPGAGPGDGVGPGLGAGPGDGVGPGLGDGPGEG